MFRAVQQSEALVARRKLGQPVTIDEALAAACGDGYCITPDRCETPGT